MRATNLTDLAIHTPSQSNWTAVVNSNDWLAPALKWKIEAAPEDGSHHDRKLMSHLGHLSILQHILSSNISSAIILENDADWAVVIRSQTPAVASVL